MRNKRTPITCVFLDIGGVLLSDGWDVHSRARAAAHFHLDLAELEIRHARAFDTYELGKLTFDDYLGHLVFYQKRSFSQAKFRDFMFSRSEPYPEMIELFAQLKVRHGLKVIVVSNEVRELNTHRIEKFKLGRFVDTFLTSCYVHLRKPDPDIFRLALDVAQVPIEQIVFVENTAMFVQIAEGLGIRSILHTDYETARGKLAELGLSIGEESLS